MQVQAELDQLLRAALKALQHLQPPAIQWIDEKAEMWDVAAFISTEALRAKHQAAGAMRSRDSQDIVATLCSLLTLPQSFHAVSIIAELANSLTQREASDKVDWTKASQVRQTRGVALHSRTLHTWQILALLERLHVRTMFHINKEVLHSAVTSCDADHVHEFKSLMTFHASFPG